MGPQGLPTGIFGPLPTGIFGLLLGRSSITMKGLQVFPGVINTDFTGEIKIMTQANNVTLPPGQCIAHLILFPFSSIGRSFLNKRENNGFGSSNAY